MHLETWLAYATLMFVVCITPGPAVVLTMGQAGSRGFRAGMNIILGVQLGNLVYFTLSAAGLGAMIAASETAFTLIKYAGAAYLLYLGVSTLLRPAAAPEQDGPPPALWRRPVAQGLVNQLANPKSILFYAAFLPQFIDFGRDLLPQLLILAATGIAIEVPVLAVYAATAARGGALLARRHGHWRQRLSGLALTIVGSAMLFVKRAA